MGFTVFAEIVSIGDELLIGQTINTNAGWMGNRLNLAGVEVLRVSTIADKEEEMIYTLNESLKRADIILLTGGLGPTSDDITKNVLAKYFGMPLILNKIVLEDVERIFKHRKRPMLEINRLQAEVPEGCEIIRNKIGTAPGMCFWKGKKMIVSMPGVPYEMKEMVDEFVLPKIKSTYKLHSILHKTILTQGIGESSLANMIVDWENSLAKDSISLAYLPSPGIVKLRLTTKGVDKDELETKVNEKIDELKELIGDLIFGYDKDLIEEIVGDLLKARKATVGTAESCTGGYMAHLLTSISGSSDYYKGSVVSYSNEIKQEKLGVNKDDLAQFGAVSKEVVEQMALGARHRLGVDYAISTSGVAGPNGGSEEKPVGTAWVAVATPNNVVSKMFVFGKSRELNIKNASIAGLNMLRKILINQ